VSRIMRWCGPLQCLPGMVIVAVLAVAPGCGKRDPFGRQPFKGFVTWEGKPIQYGSIVLEPADGQAAGAMASIRNGAFEMPRTAGPPPGRYKVWLHAYDHSGERPADGREIPPPKEMLPAKYLSRAPAEVTIEQVEGDAVNEFTFDLK
jgi:hypothetical protein